jgi:hypothetical protein
MTYGKASGCWTLYDTDAYGTATSVASSGPADTSHTNSVPGVMPWMRQADTTHRRPHRTRAASDHDITD